MFFKIAEKVMKTLETQILIDQIKSHQDSSKLIVITNCSRSCTSNKYRLGYQEQTLLKIFLSFPTFLKSAFMKSLFHVALAFFVQIHYVFSDIITFLISGSISCVDFEWSGLYTAQVFVFPEREFPDRQAKDDVC